MRFASIRSVTVGYTDDRLKALNSIITAPEIVKMYNWEDALSQLVREKRENEIESIANATSLKAFNLAFSFSVTVVINMVTFFSYNALGNAFTPQQVFTTIGLYSCILFPMLQFVPVAAQGVAECR